MSVAELLPGFGSVIDEDTVAVFEIVPVAEAAIEQVTVYVTLPPTGRFAESLMLPEPAAVQVPPPTPAHVHVHVKIGRAHV